MAGVCSALVQAQNKHSGGDRDAMKKNVFCLALGAMLFALCFSADAQQPKKVSRLGYLSSYDPVADSARAEGIRLGSARARLHRRTEHRHRVPIFGG